MSFALTISGLSKTYPNGVRALSDVSLSIPTGMFGLLGPNGAGKSTLMRTLATLQDADAGTAVMGEMDVLRDKDAVRRTLGYLPQDFGVYPKVSAEEMLDHLARLKGLSDARERREVVATLLRQTNLYDVRRKALGGYSGGMRQRFGIAQALLGNPRLVIVDEPTAGLDPEERVRFHNLLAEIAEKAKADIPESLIEDEIDRMEDEERRNLVYRGQTWQEHLELEGKTAKEHREGLRESAEARVKTGLVLGEVAEAEDVTVAEAELNERIKQLKAQYNDKQMQAELDKPENRRELRSRLLTEKTIERLVGYAAQTSK